MYNMKEHFDIVNNETMFGVHNKGMVLREDMYSMQQKIPQQLQKLVSNSLSKMWQQIQNQLKICRI